MAKRELERMTIIPGENGRHVVEHEYKRPRVDKHPLSYEAPEKHIFVPKDDYKLTAHISKTLGLDDAAEEEAEAKNPKEYYGSKDSKDYGSSFASKVRSKVGK